MDQIIWINPHSYATVPEAQWLQMLSSFTKVVWDTQSFHFTKNESFHMRGFYGTALSPLDIHKLVSAAVPRSEVLFLWNFRNNPGMSISQANIFETLLFNAMGNDPRFKREIKELYSAHVAANRPITDAIVEQVKEQIRAAMDTEIGLEPIFITQHDKPLELICLVSENAYIISDCEQYLKDGKSEIFGTVD